MLNPTALLLAYLLISPIDAAQTTEPWLDDAACDGAPEQHQSVAQDSDKVRYCERSCSSTKSACESSCPGWGADGWLACRDRCDAAYYRCMSNCQ